MADSVSIIIMIILCGPHRNKQEDDRSFLGSAHEAIRSLVRRALKSGDIRRNLDPNDLLHAFVGVSNVVSGALRTSFFEGRPHKDTTDTIV